MNGLFFFGEGQVLAFDKPLHWTSFNVVAKVRNTIRRVAQQKIKVGHAGTLDPMATGLLLLCTGKMTKQIESFQGQPKTYTGTFCVGAQRPSYDMETEISETHAYGHLSENNILSTAQHFLGDIEQVPPVFSAIQVAGKRAYTHARAGRDLTLQARKVRIETFTITDIRLPEIDFEVRCSKGTYIRSLAHDFGQQLGVGAYLQNLRRTHIGDFSVDQAEQVETWSDQLLAQNQKNL